MREYPLCSENVGRVDALQEIVLKFLGEDAQVERRRIAPEKHEYVAVLPNDRGLSIEDYAKLQQLCRLKSNDLFYQESFKADEKSTVSSSPNPAGAGLEVKELDPSKQQSKTRPDTLLVKNIPRNLSPQVLKADIETIFRAVPVIHSLAPYSSTYSCATVTFPEKEPKFPLKLIEDAEFRWRRRNSGDFDFQYDIKFTGLTPLFDAEENAQVDIIAVAGLGTHAFGTFRAPEGTQMWLRDFLKRDIPNIRVLLYGYESSVDNSDSVQTIKDLAITCLNIIHKFRARTETQNRPIIFLGQSLGGLIIQELLAVAEANSQWPEYDVFEKWYGLVGFGIPTSGLNNVPLKDAVAGQPNENLISQICVDSHGRPSPYLMSLAERFERCWRNKDFEIIYFYETKLSVPRTKNKNENKEVLMVMSGDSSRRNVRYLPIPTDHAGMVKFKSSTDVTYEYVMENLKTMVEKSVTMRGISK